MKKLTEEQIENLAIELLQNQGFDYCHGKDIAPDSDNPLRTNFDEVILKPILQDAISRLNPNIPNSAKDDALNQVLRVFSPDLKVANKEFHHLLTGGVNVIYRKDGLDRGDYVRLIDFDNIQNNDFKVVNQFTITNNGQNKRPDVILFVNGLPLVVIEFKNPADENATINSAFRQIGTYKETIPNLFFYNSFIIISDGLEAKAGTISSGFSRFMSWKSADGKNLASNLDPRLETMVLGMLNKETLLDLIRHFITFEESSFTDPKTNIKTITTVKKLASYHQYYAVNKAVLSVIAATSENGDQKGGVIWHTQGSGKSLSMVFTTAKLVLSLNNPTILVITDRNDLDDQLFDTFASSKQLLRQTPVQAENREDLKKLLKVASGGIVFTTIQKFRPDEGNIYEELSNRKNIVVIADEAHRTQYGFKAKIIDEKDSNGNKIGEKIVYGFAKYMRDALPNATYLGFTGTPIEKTDANTPAVFGNYVDIYDIARAVEDGATVKIFYESRLAKINLSDEGKQLIADLDEKIEKQDLSDDQKAKAKWTQLEALVGSKERIKAIAKDIALHFEERQKAFDGKAMIVAMSRRIAALLYQEIINLKPNWHHKDLDKGAIKVVMTASSSDGPEIAGHHTSKSQRRKLADRMKNPDDELKLVIVRDMWLTGFDAPVMNGIYIDKPMKGHNLMQAIARVNRVYKDKAGGLVVDYLGIASDLKKALSFYSDSGGKGDPAIEQEQAVSLMLEKLETISQMFYGFSYEEYFDAPTSKKLSIILASENHILGIENGKKRFTHEVSALSKAFSIAIPHKQAMDAKEEIAFFQAIKARLCKFETNSSYSNNEEMETAIRQIVDESIVSDKIVDVFDAAGIKKPDISILSEDFLLEIKNMEHKNLAIETLKKILNDEIKSRTKTNLIQSKSFMEMLQNSINRYHNKILTAAEVIDELIKLAKDISSKDKESQKMGLTEFEYAFYSAVADNESAKELMQKDKLRELAITLTKKIKQNASIDWTIRESARASMRRAIKRTLRKYGYPPDMKKLAIDNVLGQAEKLIANQINN